MCKGLIMPRDSSDDDSDSDFEPGATPSGVRPTHSRTRLTRLPQCAGDVGDSGVEETKGKQEVSC